MEAGVGLPTDIRSAMVFDDEHQHAACAISIGAGEACERCGAFRTTVAAAPGGNREALDLLSKEFSSPEVSDDKGRFAVGNVQSVALGEIASKRLSHPTLSDRTLEVLPNIERFERKPSVCTQRGLRARRDDQRHGRENGLDAQGSAECTIEPFQRRARNRVE